MCNFNCSFHRNLGHIKGYQTSSFFRYRLLIPAGLLINLGDRNKACLGVASLSHIENMYTQNLFYRNAVVVSIIPVA